MPSMTVDQLKAILGASPTKDVSLTETVDVADYDQLDLDGFRLSSTANPAFRVSAAQWSIRNGSIVAQSGVAIDLVQSSQGLVSGVRLQSWGAQNEVVRCVGSSSCFDTLFQVCHLISGPDIADPIVRISATGGAYNSNVWDTIRFQTKGNSGPPLASCVVMECVATDNWIYGNRFSNINVEMPNAGFIHCGSCFGTVIDNVTVYDAHAAGNIKEDIVRFGKGLTGGLDSSTTTIRNYTRTSGQLDEDKYDVNFANHYSGAIVLEQIQGLGSTLRVKCDIGATRIEVQDFLHTWVNSDG